MTDRKNEAMEITYLALGRLIAKECPVGFATAVLVAELHEEVTRLWITATLPDGTRVQLQAGADAARDILENLRDIRNVMAREEGTAWRSCVVTLKAGGGFAIEFEY
jgi:hypothetical protein